MCDLMHQLFIQLFTGGEARACRLSSVLHYCLETCRQAPTVSVYYLLMSTSTSTCKKLKSYTCTLMRKCYNDDDQVKLGRANFDTPTTPNQLTDHHQDLHRQLVGIPTNLPPGNILSRSYKRFCFHVCVTRCFNSSFSGGMLAWLSVWGEVQICIWPR